MAPQNLRENLDGNKLDLSMSGLTDIPVKEIATIKKATNLDLSNNQLTSLPATFGTLLHLVELDLSKNMLRVLPDSFGNLTGLKRLDLYGNQLTHLPLSFSQLKALRWLDLKNNPLTPKLAEIAGPCGDTQQCQQCARNIVSVLSSTALKVEEDRKKILEEKLREKELIEQEYLKEMGTDNQVKKNKKKTKKNKTEKSKTDDVKSADIASKEWATQSLQDTTVSQEKETSGRGFVSTAVGAVFYLLRAVLFCCLLVLTVFLCGVIFATYDSELYQNTMDKWGVVPNSTSSIVLNSVKYVESAIKHPFVKETHLHLASSFRSAFGRICNIYETICRDFPTYYDTIIKKFS